jgi:hypothetical protein
MDNKIEITSKKRIRSVPHTVSPVKKRSTTTTDPPERQPHGPATSCTPKIIRGETLLHTPGTPISYTFHSCDASMVREALRLIHTEDIPLNLNLKTLTLSLPKHIDDSGTAVPWLVSLAACLAWCFHYSSTPEVIITGPEMSVKEPCISVNEVEPPKLRVDLYAGSPGSQENTDFVVSFLCFTQGLPKNEMEIEEQAISALADFLHDRPDKCKQCVLWRAAWKECLRRLYGEHVAKSMARKRKFQSAHR